MSVCMHKVIYNYIRRYFVCDNICVYLCMYVSLPDEQSNVAKQTITHAYLYLYMYLFTFICNYVYVFPANLGCSFVLRRHLQHIWYVQELETPQR